MSVFKDILVDVEELLSTTDMTVPEIAAMLSVPVDVVYDAVDFLEETFACYDTVDEAQEWHDFDPDC